MSNNKNIYIGAMSGTSHDAIDVSITEIGKDITLKSFFSKRIPNSVRVRIKNIMESDSTTLIELGQLNKKIGHLFAQAINESIKKAKLKKNRINCVAISGQTITRNQVDASTDISNLTTSNVSEGANQYYTDARVKTKLTAENVISGSAQITDLTTHKETVSGASSYAVDHNLGEQYPIVQAWNTGTSQQEVPTSITTNSVNRVTVVFSSTFAGIIIVKK